VIAAAMTVHRELGPGLDEYDYHRALTQEFDALEIEYQSQVPLPLIYKGHKLDCGFRVDLMVARKLLLELKAVERLHPIYEAQLITYLRLSGIRLGLLLNFSLLTLREGIMRRANTRPRNLNPSLSVTPRHEDFDPLSWEVIAAAYEVRRSLGVGLLRSAYESALTFEMRQRGLQVKRSQAVTFSYRGVCLRSRRQIPMVVEDRLMVSCLCVNSIEPIHLASQRSLIKDANLEGGICFNFHGKNPRMEIRRL
jgi:GxxExxY protein